MPGPFLASPTFWQATAERAVKSAAQGAILAWGADAAGVLTSRHAAATVALAAAAAAILSILTSIATAGATDGSPSVGSAEVLATPGAMADPMGGEPVAVEPVDDAYVPEHAAPDPSELS